ncbi:hypothetical protein DFQ27_002722 [Actinomortierella ambigua]|uniref:Uncharacterized protein n=1 Tax=Actinomortierella ambigua TaxID=1343610 RepID=A0A9P6QAT3_9FUNG|nr:hypothetical protein DFQ27_002722 [Actinomortierella ambigua]
MGTGSGSDTGPVTRRGDGGGRRMGSFHVPQQVVQMRKEATLLEITTHVNVTDASALAYFFQSALAESVLELGVEGQLRTHMGKLWPLNLQLTTLVPVEGMKGIQDATLVSMALPGDDPRGGVTIEGVARLHNPSSSLSVDLGRLTFGVYLSNNDSSALHTAESKLRHQYKVAELLCSHVELKAHETVDLAVAGRLLHLDDWVPVSPALTALHILKSEKQLMLSGLLSRYIQGEDSVVAIRALPEPEMVRWLQVVVQSIALNVRFPGSPQKDFIQGIDMKQLSFGFDKNVTSSPSRSAEIRGRLTTHLQLPKNVTFPITVAELYPEVELFRLGSMSDGGNDDNGSRLANPTPMARINLPGSLPAESVQNGNALQVDVSFESGSLVVFPGQEQTFYGFLNESFTKDKIILGVTGQARALVETGMGTFELGPIPFTTRTTQKGLGGLIGVPPKLEQIDVVDSTENSLTIKARLVLINPSSISASLGSLSFFWGYNGFLVGLATVPSAALVPGPNTIETLGMMDSSLDCRQRRNDPTCDPDDAAQAARAFLSGYISGDNTTAIDILGHAESTKIPLLQPLISSLTIRSSLPVMEQDFLLSTTMYLLSSSIVLELLNPLDTPIWVLYINGTAFYKDEPLGHIRVDFERDITTPKPIEIPANDHQDENSGYTKTPRLPVSFELSSIGYEALKQALGGTLEVGILCHIKARVGNMVQWIDYHKDSVPTKAPDPLLPSSSSSSKGKAPLSQLASTTASAAAAATGSEISSSASSALSAMANSAVDMARNTLAALDPRHADVVRLNGSTIGGVSSSSSAKPSTSASRSAFQHASRAMETLSESSSSSSSGSQPSAASPGVAAKTAFRTQPSTGAGTGTGTGVGGPMMDWDSFLASPESDLIDDAPYRPPPMSAFSFSSMRQTPMNTQAQYGASAATTTTTARTWEQQELWKSAYVSHPEDTIPAFTPPAVHMSTTTLSSDVRWVEGGSGGGALVSRMVQQQQMTDGMDVVAFLNSTSHADYVEALEVAEVDRHQQQRKQFQYDSGNNNISSTQALRQQDLPSDQQDIVAYVEGQRTLADDIDARPFAHDEVGQELRSLMAERADQERFLQGIMSLKAAGSEEGAVATTTGEQEATLEEMEAIMDRVTLASQGSQGDTSTKETKDEKVEKTVPDSDNSSRQAAVRKRRQQNGPRL